MTRFKIVATITLMAFAAAPAEVRSVSRGSMPPKVQYMQSLWMVTFIDDTGVETVAQAKLVSGEYAPLLAADAERLESMLPAAQNLATVNKIKMRLVQFTSRVDLREINP